MSAKSSGRRLLVLAGAWDAQARAFADRAGPEAVILATPRDLSRAGWRFQPDAPEAAVAVAGGDCVPAAAIGCVLTRLPAVAESDLPHIAAEDRAYVAAEMTAFLLALLAGLGRPVVNRPTPQCLCGPQGTDAAWRRMAASLSLVAAPFRLRAALDVEAPPEPPGHLVAVVGEEAFEAVDPRQGAAAVALARHIGADLLTVIFDPDAPLAILRALPQVDIGKTSIAEAVAAVCARAATT